MKKGAKRLPSLIVCASVEDVCMDQCCFAEEPRSDNE